MQLALRFFISVADYFYMYIWSAEKHLSATLSLEL